MNTTTHPVPPEEVMALLDGELSAGRAQSVSAHIETCSECGDVAELLRDASRSLSSWTVVLAPSRLEDRVMAASTRTQPPPASVALDRLLGPRRRWTWRRWGLTLATAGCAFLLLLAISIPNLLRSKIARNEGASAQHRGDETDGFISVDHSRPVTSARRGALGNLVEPSTSPGSPAASPMSNALPLAEEGRNAVSLALQEPMIARIASLSIVVKNFDAGRISLDSILARHNGYTASLNVSTPEGAARALQASLRIPAPQLAPALAELKALGRVEGEAQSGEEVTQQHADLVARLKNSRETEQRLQAILLQRTGKISDVLSVEREIARVRGEIEQMEVEQQTLEHRVDFATIDLKLAEEYKAQLTSPAPSVSTQIRNSCVTGFRNAFESLLALILFLAEAGPALLLWSALLLLPAWRLWRRYQRVRALGPSLGV